MIGHFPRRQARGIPEWIPAVLVILSGIYDLPATIIGIPAPNLFALLLTAWAITRLNFPIHTFLISLIWIACAGLSDWFSPAHINTTALTKNIAQCLWSIYLYGISQKYIENTDAAKIYKISGAILIVLLVIGSLETLQPVSDAVVQLSTEIYKGDSGFVFQYDDAAQERDAALAGARRSTMFMAEPSLAGIAIAILTTLRALTGTRVSYLQTFAITGLGFFLTRSPFCLLTLIFAPLIKRHKDPNLSTRGLFISAIATLLVAIPLLAARFAFFSLKEDYLTSEALRFMIPVIVFFGTILNGYIFGLGPSGFADDDTILSITGGLIDTPGTNALFAFFTTIGPPIGMAFILLALRLNPRFPQLGRFAKLMQLFFLAAISITVGSFVAPKIWILFGTFTGCLVTTTGFMARSPQPQAEDSAELSRHE